MATADRGELGPDHYQLLGVARGASREEIVQAWRRRARAEHPARAARPEGWRVLMVEVRAAAGRLAARGEVDITQGGRTVDIAAVRGPVRIRRRRPG